MERSLNEHLAIFVTIDNGAMFNVMSLSMWRQLRGGFEQLAHDARLRCVLVQGAARNF